MQDIQFVLPGKSQHIYFATIIFDNSPARIRLINSNLEEVKESIYEPNILMAEILATSMGGTIQNCLTDDFRVFKLLLPIRGRAVYESLKLSGSLD